MKLVNALKRLMNKGIQIQKDSDDSEDYSFEKGSLIFEFISVDGDTAVNFQAWNKETQETFYFKNFKNMMIYFDEIQDTQEIQAVPVKIKIEPSVIEEPEVEQEKPKKYTAKIVKYNDKFAVQLNEEGSYISDGYSTIALFDTPEEAIKGCSHLKSKLWNIDPFEQEENQKTAKELKETEPTETVHYSEIVDNKQIKSSHKEFYRFDNALAFKEYLESSDSQSSVHFLLFAEEHGLNFFIPMWHYKDGLKLWVGYDHKESCYTVFTIKHETIKLAVDAQPEYTPVFLFEEMEDEHQKAIKDFEGIINSFKASREDQEAEIIEENRQFFIRLLMNKVSEIEIRMIISMHINMINLGEYEIEYNEDEEYTIQQVYDFFKEREMVIEYCETVDVNEEYFTKREKEVFDYALSLCTCTRPVPEPEKNNTQKKEVNQYPKFRKKKFEYNDIKIRIADIEEQYLNSTVVTTRCIAPNNEPFGPALGQGESLNDLIDNVKRFLTKAEKNGIDIARRLNEVDKNYTVDEMKIYGVCPYCGNNITKNDLTSMKKYVCKGCKIDFDEDEWNTIQEAFDWALSAL